MVETTGALVVCVLNAGSPGAGPRINGLPLGVRLPLPPLDFPLLLPLPLPLGTNEGLPLPRPFPNPFPLTTLSFGIRSTCEKMRNGWFL